MVAVLAATQLEVIRVLYDRPALTWNIGWRFHLNHAQAIARYAASTARSTTLVHLLHTTSVLHG